MAVQTRFALTIAALLIAGVSGGADRVEIIVDNSAAMSDAVGGKEPRVIALREVLGSFAVSTNMLNNDLEIGLRTMGGRHELTDDGACDDTLFGAVYSSETPPSKPMDSEVLATLDAPAEVSAGEELEVTWTGPDGPQDYLSIAEPGAENEAYLEWALTGEGNPLRLRAPRSTGDFELRYVRAEDGEVLARRQVTVVAEAVSLEAPPEVEAGSRFVVEWSGTPGGGDFIAIAKEDVAAGEHLDWSYTTAGRRLTLAAPFHPGRYEVRYVSGSEVEILARKPLMVR